jgi:hypothetical protein
MFEEDELAAFYAGKEQGYNNEEYKNPHLEFLSGIDASPVAFKEDRKSKQFKRGYEWGKAQKDEEQSS